MRLKPENQKLHFTPIGAQIQPGLFNVCDIDYWVMPNYKLAYYF